MNKQELAARIWETANNMRSKIEANEYKDYILGFIFYKFLSEQEETKLKSVGWQEDAMKDDLYETNNEVVKFCQAELGYFIGYENLFSTWLSKGSDFDVSNIRDALSAFNRLINEDYKKLFENIFHILETGLTKLGDNAGSQTKAIRKLIELINPIPMDNQQGYDVLGFIYEYLISMFAANAGKKAGEFYTPHEVSIVMSQIVANHLKDRKKIQIYDPTSGSGSLLINIGKSISKYRDDTSQIQYYAQELKESTYTLTRMNLIMRGIRTENIKARNGDTLADDWPYFDDNNKELTYDPLFVDAVVSNPPYSQKWEPKEDKRFDGYGKAPKSKADYAFLLHDLYHLNSQGIMTIVLPHGVLFRGNEEREIRKNLVEKDNISAIIGLPANIFFGTGIPTIIMVLQKDRTDNDILIVDASKGFEKVGKSNKLRSSDIKKIVDTVINRKTIDKYSRLVSKKEIRENDYNLNIPRYIDSSKKNESYDIYALMFGGVPNKEIDEFEMYWKAFPNLRKQIFKTLNEEYSEFITDELKNIVENSVDLIEYKEKFKNSFNGLESLLYSTLIENISCLNEAQEESEIADEVFRRLEKYELIDNYEAYQKLDDCWRTIAVDSEIIKTEGLKVINQVDPNIVLTKKDGKDVEEQKGWRGHILPFELVQQKFLKEDIDLQKQQESELEKVTNQLGEIFDSLAEEDMIAEGDCFNKDFSKFIKQGVSKFVKSLKGQTITDTESFEYKMIEVDKLLCEEANYKKALKDLTGNITKQTIDLMIGMSQENQFEMLGEKWIKPILESFNTLIVDVVDNFISQLKKLYKKYEATLTKIDTEITTAECELANLIEELECNEFDKKGLEEFQKLLRRE